MLPVTGPALERVIQSTGTWVEIPEKEDLIGASLDQSAMRREGGHMPARGRGLYISSMIKRKDHLFKTLLSLGH